MNPRRASTACFPLVSLAAVVSAVLLVVWTHPAQAGVQLTHETERDHEPPTIRGAGKAD